jgi:hypothetical protein
MKPIEISARFDELSAQLFHQCRHGDLLRIENTLCWESSKICSGYSHPEGLILRRETYFRLNGKSMWEPARGYKFVYQRNDGIIIYNGAEAYLNGKTRVQPTDFFPQRITASPAGGASDIASSDGKVHTLVFSDPCGKTSRTPFEDIEIPKDWVDQWEWHHWGVLIRKGNTLFILILKKF